MFCHRPDRFEHKDQTRMTERYRTVPSAVTTNSRMTRRTTDARSPSERISSHDSVSPARFQLPRDSTAHLQASSWRSAFCTRRGRRRVCVNSVTCAAWYVAWPRRRRRTGERRRRVDSPQRHDARRVDRRARRVHDRATFAPASYTAVVRRTGFAPDSFTVTIRAGETVTHDIILDAAARELDRVIISASPRLNETIEQALAKQKNADNLVTSCPATSFARCPTPTPPRPRREFRASRRSAMKAKESSCRFAAPSRVSRTSR